jgi:hypothetical protein
MYRVRTAKGSEFEYTIENVNGVLSPIEMEDLMAAEAREDVVLAEQSRCGICDKRCWSVHHTCMCIIIVFC